MYLPGKCFNLPSVVKLLVCMALVAVVSCRKEQSTPLHVDFSYHIVDSNYTVPARIHIQNKTTGAALFYKWSFENANLSEYTKKDPGEILISRPGVVRIKLEAWNDDERKEKVIELIMDSVTIASFIQTARVNNIAPAEFDFQFTGQGASEFKWSIEGISVPLSTERNPTAIRFDQPGNYRVLLQVKNSRGRTDSVSKWISVASPLSADFDIVASFDDDDYEAPLVATLANRTTSGTIHQWIVPGGVLSSSSDSIPSVTFNNPGTYNVTYLAGNTKQSATITKTIHIKANSRLRSFSNVELGINTAHGSIGSFFSTKLRKVFNKDSISAQNGGLIDICFFGLSSSFSFNKFISPDSVHRYTFQAIPLATTTVFVNKQENCSCGILSSSEFDGVSHGTLLDNITVSNSQTAGADFNATQLPRIILFQNAAGKKGAIKIKQFVSAGAASYIICDIKVQKD